MTPQAIREMLLVPWTHGRHVDLRGIRVDGVLDLSNCDLAGVDFTGARFPDGIIASGARFLGLSWFRDVQIGGVADFSGATFLNDARFEGANFQCKACFREIDLRGIGRFDRAVFTGGADFSGAVAYGNFSLQQVNIATPALFRGCEWLGGLWCQDTLLPQDADFIDTQVHGRLWLRGAHRGTHVLLGEDFGMSFGYVWD